MKSHFLAIQIQQKIYSILSFGKKLMYCRRKNQAGASDPLQDRRNDPWSHVRTMEGPKGGLPGALGVARSEQKGGNTITKPQEFLLPPRTSPTLKSQDSRPSPAPGLEAFGALPGSALPEPGDPSPKPSQWSSRVRVSKDKKNAIH